MDGKRKEAQMSETEKITINLSVVDLGKIELLVQEGLYANRSDFIRTAIRNQISQHNFELQQSVKRHSFVIGVISLDREKLERTKLENRRLEITAIGMLVIDRDVPPSLADETIASVRVLGTLRASDEVKGALADRIQ